MSKNIRVGWSFLGQRFAGTLLIPDEYIRDNGSIDQMKLVNLLGTNGQITFGEVCPIQVSKEFTQMLNARNNDINHTIRENGVTINQLTAAVDEVNRLIEELKQRTGRLEQLNTENETLLLPNGKR